MDNQTIWNLVFVILSFGLYIGIAIWARVKSTKGFYVAGQGVPTVLNGMATGADWMSAASFMGMAGLISVMGYTGSMYLIGWTGGYVLLAMLLAPYLRKFGKFTVPDFVGDRYYSNAARAVAIFCAIFVSFTYVCGQMRGVGIVFANLLGWNITMGVIVGIGMVFFYATLGGMKGITYTQVAQYCVLISAFVIPAVAISFQMTGNPVPQLGFGAQINGGENAGLYLLDALDKIHADLGLPEYTATFVTDAAGNTVAGKKSMIDMFMITVALMAGTAGLPHVIIRFYTVKTVGAARWSAFWALIFIGILYTTAPAVGAFARVNLLQTTHDKPYESVPGWFKKWENSGLIAWVDKNNDGKIQFGGGNAFVTKKPKFTEERGQYDERVLATAPSENANELYVDRDIMVLANPEIAQLPAWVVALVAAGGLAAALSTAAGLLLVISSSVSHDLLKSIFRPDMTEKQELFAARVAAGVAVVIAGYFGIHPPDYVAALVAFAFGLAASSFFPAIILGIFSKRVNKEGAISGMVCGIGFTASYILYFKFFGGKQEQWLWGISPEGIGTIGMLLNFAVTLIVSRFTPEPPEHVKQQVEMIRYPNYRVGQGEK